MRSIFNRNLVLLNEDKEAMAFFNSQKTCVRFNKKYVRCINFEATVFFCGNGIASFSNTFTATLPAMGTVAHSNDEVNKIFSQEGKVAQNILVAVVVDGKRQTTVLKKKFGYKKRLRNSVFRAFTI